MNWRALLDRLLGTAPDTADVLDAAERVESGLSRRQFLRGALIATTAAALVDVDQLLWMPGEKTIFLPECEVYTTLDWVARDALSTLENNLRMISRFNRAYDRRFDGVRVGDTVQVWIPKRFEPHDYSGIVTESVLPVTITPELRRRRRA